MMLEVHVRNLLEIIVKHGRGHQHIGEGFRLKKALQRCCLEQKFQGGCQNTQCSEAAKLFQKPIQNESTNVRQPNDYGNKKSHTHVSNVCTLYTVQH